MSTYRCYVVLPKGGCVWMEFQACSMYQAEQMAKVFGEVRQTVLK